MAPLIRRPRAEFSYGDRAAALGMFGMVPHWAKVEPEKYARNTYNARRETVAEKPSFRSAWKRGQFCIIPAASIFEPRYFQINAGLDLGDEHSKKPEYRKERWEIANVDAAPLAIAAIWEIRNEGPNGLPLLSFSMLTINADNHPVMNQFHDPADEKRMVVMLRQDQYDDWLNCPADEAEDLLQQYPAELLTAHPAPRGGKEQPALL
jgi:putative SOS response-associated peptidase YedK